MNKEVRLLGLLIVTVVFAVWTGGCRQKPAYSEMDTKQGSNNQNQNQNQNQSAESQPAASIPTPPPSAPADAAQPAPPPAGATINSPTFLDPSTGGIKDLPSYPGAYRVSVQIGPIQGFNTMSLGYTSGEPMAKISAFYERVIKDNKWTVMDKLVDPEFSEWNLKKGEDNTAKVQVKKDPQTNAFTIVMVRAEKETTPTK